MKREAVWQRMHVRVHTVDGWQDVDAVVCGPFAIHRPLAWGDGTRSKGWTLTHLPSGRRAADLSTREKAKRLAFAICDMSDMRWHEVWPYSGVPQPDGWPQDIVIFDEERDKWIASFRERFHAIKESLSPPGGQRTD